MRNIRLLILFPVFLLALFLPAYAAGSTTYDLDELDMSIDIPDEYYVFTRDTPASDPNYALLDINKADLDSLMESRDIYLNAIMSDPMGEIVITKISSSLKDFSTLTDRTLSQLASDAKQVYEQAGVTYLRHELYQHAQTKFIKVYLSQQSGGQTVYGLQYYTVCDAKAINITLHSYAGPIDADKEAIIKDIVDTADFWNAKSAAPAESPEPTAAFQYTDPETGLTFTVPENWSQQPPVTEAPSIDARFVPAQEPSLSILYGSIDYWETLSAGDKLGLTRADLNNDLLSDDVLAAFAEGLGADSSKITRVTHAGVEYFKAEATASSQVGSMTITVPMVVLIRMDNGVLYIFQFTDRRTSPYYQDFVSLMSSVEYPAPLADQPEPTPAFPLGLIIVIALLLVLIIVVVIVSCRSAAAKREQARQRAQAQAETPPAEEPAPAQASAVPWQQAPNAPPPAPAEPVPAPVPPPAPVEPVPVPQPEPAPEPVAAADSEPLVLFCHKCGAKVPIESKYCHKCGTKLFRGNL